MRKTILIFFFALLGILSARAYDFKVDGIYYNIISGSDDQVEVTSSGDWDIEYTGSVAIPSTITYNGDTYRVTAIGRQAFFECSDLTSVTIPNSVISIGEDAFAYCSGLTSVTFPESVDTIIGIGAFRYTALSSPLYNNKIFAYMPPSYSGEYAIPSGIQSIAGGAFVNCNGLSSVTIPNSVTSIGRWAFFGCNGLTSVTIGESVTSIGDAAFSQTGLVSVTSLAQTPPRFVEDEDPEFNYLFEGFTYGLGTLYVPQGCKEAYASAPEWRKFLKIKEISDAGTATVTVQPNDVAMGTVVGGGEYEIGEQITLAAVPNAGYHFVKWDDENTANPRILTVTRDTTLTAIFAKDSGEPTANENSDADNFRVYVQGRTIHLSEDRGAVQVYNMAGQRVYNGHATAIPVPQSGVYIVVANGQRLKVSVR